ncbi:hypothetical protein LTR53_017111 [Teratosphaeriaceae sp. CCFEE 6253]|nr:hypothetical protein LTR53_017111 [Teratosphaeriaceae sp. CCFEE 6253]
MTATLVPASKAATRVVSDMDYVSPDYSVPIVSSLQDVIQERFASHVDPNGPIRKAKDRASQARTSKELWQSGVYDLVTLPYIQSELLRSTLEASSESHSHDAQRTALRPRARRGDQRSTGMAPDGTLAFQRCVSCAGIYEYRLEQQWIVSIWAGLPQGGEYTAISYVWGDVSNTAVRPTKFRDIMALAGAGSFVWLDALSIDQADKDDLAEQVPAMGTIYEGASRVCVLLPAMDSRAYQLLATLSFIAKQIVWRPAHFIFNYEDASEALEEEASRGKRSPARQGDDLFRPTYGDRTTSELCTEFFACLDTFAECVPTFRYWDRAWTFQEWAMASDVDLAMEGVSEDRITAHRSFTSVKSAIFTAASIASQYRSLEGDYCKVRFEHSRSQVVEKFNIVKRLFPLEACQLAPDEIDVQEYQFESQMPSTGCHQLLGLRSQPRRNGLETTQARLQLMLDAFSSSDRHAKFDADLIACWATMCNVRYDYDKDDTLLQALGKAKRALRAAGIKIFDFIPENMESPDQRALSFFALAKPHRMHNATHGAFFPGLPILTGRSDPLEHLRMVLAQDRSQWHATLCPEDLRTVRGVKLRSAPLIEQERFLALFADTASDQTDNVLFGGLQAPLTRFLSIVPQDYLRLYRFTRVDIPTASSAGRSIKHLKSWALCPIFVPEDAVFVARECVNGCFVLATRLQHQVVMLAYLTVTDTMSGTLLLRSDEDGRVNLLLDAPKRSDMAVAYPGGRAVNDDRRIRCRINLGRVDQSQ